MDRLPPIPTPLAQRWREFRVQVVPVLVFAAALTATAVLWKRSFAAPTLTGEVDVSRADVRTLVEGMLTNLLVSQFQLVKAGDPVAIVDTVTEASSLDVLQARSSLLRVEARQPEVSNLVDRQRLQFDLMSQQVQLETAKINLREAENELQRVASLFKEKIASAGLYEFAVRTRDVFQSEVTERAKLIANLQQGLASFQSLADLTRAGEARTMTALSNRVSELERGQGRVILRAPMDGMVTRVYHHAGETVAAAEPILTISSTKSTQIIGFLRQPIAIEPRIGMAVHVRTRGIKRQVGSAQILRVGTIVESIINPLRIRGFDVTQERGLPLTVSMPPNFPVRPGELVDLILVPDS